MAEKVRKWPAQIRFYLYNDEEGLFKEFERILEREGSDKTKKLKEFVRNYVQAHGKGNPQQLLDRILKTSKPYVAPKACVVCGLPAEFQSFTPVKAYFCLKHFNRKKHESWKKFERSS